jgi:hypothetical protein
MKGKTSMVAIEFLDTFPDAQATHVDEAPAEPSLGGLIELMLKDRGRLHSLLRTSFHRAEVIPKFLAIALAGFTIYGIAATVVLNVGGVRLPWIPNAAWNNPTVANLTLAYDLGLIAAVGICLPSFYFYGLLAGVEITMLDVTAHAMKCAAMTAIMLVGILPIYVALALGVTIFNGPTEWKELVVVLGLALPFIAGLWGVRSLYVGFVRLAEDLPPRRRDAREGFLKLLTLAWSTCYSVVTPVMIYTLWKHFSG